MPKRSARGGLAAYLVEEEMRPREARAGGVTPYLASFGTVKQYIRSALEFTQAGVV